MALRAVPDHPKFADLMARLGRPKYVALGCLEAVWHFTGRFTPQGNIGKYTDHRSVSPLNQKANLSTWVARSLAWLDAPADEWGKPINGGNRNGYGNRGQARSDANDEAARRAAASLVNRFGAVTS